MSIKILNYVIPNLSFSYLSHCRSCSLSHSLSSSLLSWSCISAGIITSLSLFAFAFAISSCSSYISGLDSVTVTFSPSSSPRPSSRLPRTPVSRFFCSCDGAVGEVAVSFDAHQRLRVLYTQHLLLQLQRLSMHRLGLLVFALSRE
jgi:hypothetical protein